MSDTVYNLDVPCNHEGCDIGLIADHTMRQWAEHGATRRDSLEYEEVPDDIQQALRNRISGLDDYALADGIITKAAVADMASGPLKIHMPVMLFDFSIGRPGRAPLTVANVAFLGRPEIMRDMGRLLGDTARGAANAAEKGGRR